MLARSLARIDSLSLIVVINRTLCTRPDTPFLPFFLSSSRTFCTPYPVPLTHAPVASTPPAASPTHKRPHQICENSRAPSRSLSLSLTSKNALLRFYGFTPFYLRTILSKVCEHALDAPTISVRCIPPFFLVGMKFLLKTHFFWLSRV